MATGVTIRKATRADAAAIHRMVVDLARATGKLGAVSSTVDDIAREGFGDKPAFEALIAFDGEEAVGLALYFPEFSTWRGERGVYLQDLYVAETARRAGLGRRLVEALAAEAGRQGAAYLRLSVDAANQRAAAFYERLGFAEMREDRMFILKDARFEALRSK
ncbi:MAG: GNAT family N-acetyltransferase [Pseudomonadota bacterium]|nr:GNAT family N-acetyltransferase [Pseudomonadota bacterium]